MAREFLKNPFLYHATDDNTSSFLQKSYEHMAKIRIAREAPSECNCPAGKMELI